MNGSLQLQRYASARRNGRSMMNAAIEAGIGIGEARLIENDEVRAAAAEDRAPFATIGLFDPVGRTPSPPQPIPAPEPALQPKEDDMARPKKSDTPINGEVPKPDFELAAKIYREDIRPAMSGVGEHAQEMSTAYKEIKKRAHIQPQAARLAFRLVDDGIEAKRDDFLRSFKGLLERAQDLRARSIWSTQAEGKGTSAKASCRSGSAQPSPSWPPSRRQSKAMRISPMAPTSSTRPSDAAGQAPTDVRMPGQVRIRTADPKTGPNGPQDHRGRRRREEPEWTGG
jgi:hypothetical protein